jgi:hypothetical protein
MATPRLITPDGKTVELSRETYKLIKNLLREGRQNAPRTHTDHIDATYGKYAGKPSLVQSLLKERKAELAREDAKLRRRND